MGNMANLMSGGGAGSGPGFPQDMLQVRTFDDIVCEDSACLTVRPLPSR